MGKRYMEVFQAFDGVTGFFSFRDGASDGYPYNRDDVFRELGLEGAFPVWPKQVHGSRIEVIGKMPSEPLWLHDTDGAVTDQKDVLLTTVHADCLPVYFYDPQRKVIGLVHAGWRGTVAAIAAKAVYEMKRAFGCKSDDINAYIGPGISRCCFETGREVYEEFSSLWDFMPQVTDIKKVESGETKYYIDLKEINRRQLTAAGIASENIETSPHCTFCEPELFCSYRREGGTYKRMGAGLCMR